MADGILTPCNVACDSGIIIVNSPSGSIRNVICGSGMTCHWIRTVGAPCNVTRSSGIMTLNSPGGSTLQCGRLLWDGMPWNLPKRPPHLNSTSGFNFDHITAVDMSFCTSLRNFIQIGPPSAEKNDVMSIFKMADLRHLGFLEWVLWKHHVGPTTSYRSSIETIALNCLVFEKIAYFAFWRQTDKQTDGQHRCTKPFSLL